MMNIQLLSTIAAKAAEFYTNEVEAMPALQNLNDSIDCAICAAGLHFANEAAASNARSLVKRTMATEQADVYREVYPPVHMDANGNYTTDSSRWA
jgi:hypothetical protein